MLSRSNEELAHLIKLLQPHINRRNQNWGRDDEQARQSAPKWLEIRDDWLIRVLTALSAQSGSIVPLKVIV